jgi:hypothetical protein
VTRMRFTNSAFIVLLAAAALATEPVSAAGRGGRSGAGKSGSHRGHHHHHRHFIGATGGVFFGDGYYSGGPYPPPYYSGYAAMDSWAAPYYIERGDEGDPAAGWLYCPAANAYFPTVVECVSGWVNVPARP